MSTFCNASWLSFPGWPNVRNFPGWPRKIISWAPKPGFIFQSLKFSKICQNFVILCLFSQFYLKFGLKRDKSLTRSLILVVKCKFLRQVLVWAWKNNFGNVWHPGFQPWETELYPLHTKSWIFNYQGGKTISVEIDLNCRGILLKNDISKELDQPADHLKLICTGKVVSEQLTLREQNIKVSVYKTYTV